MIEVMVVMWLTEGPWLRCCVKVAGEVVMRGLLS